MQHRHHRRILGDEDHTLVWETPAAFTRESRRAVGYRQPVHAQTMRDFYAEHSPVPRAVRRLFRDPALAQKRLRRKAAKVLRLFSKRGMNA